MSKMTRYSTGEKPGTSHSTSGHDTMTTELASATFLRPTLSERLASGT